LRANKQANQKPKTKKPNRIVKFVMLELNRGVSSKMELQDTLSVNNPISTTELSPFKEDIRKCQER
jgi:hypothetical protein